ncbi:MAG: CBS domain-containing protein [Candidatus Aenigmarchaeota archaeon]|nr:CBS domain-containing protein [Candidatus Aenigmarchaeota archaeon]MCK5333879.1 CBS domain-containing protein [Candidatus Aenigmarchaeota archaeon]
MEIKAKDVMTKDIVRVEAGEHAGRAAKILAEKKIHNVAVFENGEYAGLFGYKQLLRMHTRDPESLKVKTGVKNHLLHPPKISPDASLIDVADYMYRLNYKALPIFSEGELKGIVSEQDVIRALADSDEISKKTAHEFMTPMPYSVMQSECLGKAVAIMRDNNLSRIPVTDADGKIVGVVESIDLMRMVVSKERYGYDEDSSSSSAAHVPKEVALDSVPVKSVMQENPLLSKEDDLLKDKLPELNDRPEISTIIVVDNNLNAIGIISPKDIIHHIAALKEKEVLYIQISGLESIDGIDSFQKEEMHKTIDTTVKKLARVFNIHSVAIHVKAYQTEGTKSKYVMRCRIKTDKGFVSAKEYGWDPVDVSVRLMSDAERLAIEGAKKKRDLIRRKLHDAKDAEVA